MVENSVNFKNGLTYPNKKSTISFSHSNLKSEEISFAILRKLRTVVFVSKKSIRLDNILGSKVESL